MPRHENDSGILPRPERYAESLVSRDVREGKKTLVPPGRHKPRAAPSPKITAAVKSLRGSFNRRGPKNHNGYPWVQRRRDKFIASVYLIKGGKTDLIRGPSRASARDACLDAIAIRREHHMPVPEQLLRRLQAEGPLEVGAPAEETLDLSRYKHGYPYIAFNNHARSANQYFGKVEIRFESGKKRQLYGPARPDPAAAFLDAVAIRRNHQLSIPPAIAALADKLSSERTNAADSETTTIDRSV